MFTLSTGAKRREPEGNKLPESVPFYQESKTFPEVPLPDSCFHPIGQSGVIFPYIIAKGLGKRVCGWSLGEV